MDTITTQLADCLHGERLREADRARLAVSARAARRSARRACPAALRQAGSSGQSSCGPRCKHTAT